MKPLKPERIVLIGASTGGPAHIGRILNALTPGFGAAVMIAQHMNDTFIPTFIRQLDQQASISVLPLEDGMSIHAGSAYVCRGRIGVDAHDGSLRCSGVDMEAPRYNPDIDRVFGAFARFAPQTQLLGVILTGIGDDGVGGCAELSLAGARCMTEDESSAVVYGMPQRAKERVANVEVAPLEAIIAAILEFGA